MIRLRYKNEEHFAKTLTKLFVKFPELKEFKNRIYNNRMSYKGPNFEIEKIKII